MRPPMFHLRFARSFVRFTQKAPQVAPFLRLPKRRTHAHEPGACRHKSLNLLAKRRRGLSPPRCASPPSHCGYAFVRPSADRRPPMLHQRYARSDVRHTQKAPQGAPIPR